MRVTIVLAATLAILGVGASAQSRPGTNPSVPGNAPERSMPPLPNPRTDGPDTLPRVLYLSGKVVTEEGTPPADRVLIQSNCEGTIRSEGYTAQTGTFSIELTNTRNRVLSGPAMASDTLPDAGTLGDLRQNTPSDWRKCEVKAVLAGFISPIVDLATKPPAFGSVNVGTLVLRRISTADSPTVSTNTAQAPPEARSSYEKGLEAKTKGNLDAAEERFRKALDLYPQFALSWLELGRVQTLKKDTASARVSFHESIRSDARLMGPYQELAQIAAREKQWQEVVDNTEELLKLNSTAYPEFWFYNCVAKYQLGDLAAAERSAREGVNSDPQHRVPKMEYVLGAILLQKGDYAGSAQHLQEYLRLLPAGPDSTDARKKLDEIAKMQ